MGFFLNVRCPNCSAVFPVSQPSEKAGGTVECPLCLLRFTPERENTDSIKSKPLQVSGTADPGLSSLADLTHGNTTMLQPSAIGKPDWAAQPAATPAPKPVSGVSKATSHEVDFAQDSAGVIDFDALLSDAVQAVEKAPTTSKATPFGRMSSPRISAVISEEAIFAPGSRPAQPVVKVSAEAPDADSLFESGSPSLFHDPQFASSTSHRDDEEIVQRPRIELPRRALPSKSQLGRKLIQDYYRGAGRRRSWVLARNLWGLAISAANCG